MTGALVKVQDAPAEVSTRDVLTAPADAHLDLDALLRIADMVVPSGLLPKHVRSPGQFLAIALAGRELGMPIMRSLRSLMLVEGKVQEAADSQLSRFKKEGGHAKWLKLTDREAELWLRHPNGDEHTQPWTWADAERAKLTRKDNWQNHPQAMLRSRCITAGLKALGWEGGVGAYDPDEVAEFAPPETKTPAQPAPAAESAALATDEQRSILSALSDNVVVFTPAQCDTLSDAAASASTTFKQAAKLILKAQKAIEAHDAKTRVTTIEHETASAEGNASAPEATMQASGASSPNARATSPTSIGTATPATSTTATPGSTHPTSSTTNRVRRPAEDAPIEAWRAYARALLADPSVAQFAGMDVERLDLKKLKGEISVLEAVLGGKSTEARRSEQGRKGQAAMQANKAKRAEAQQASLTDDDEDPLGGDDGDDERTSWDS